MKAFFRAKAQLTQDEIGRKSVLAATTAARV
jgi:hypothetical protein